MRRFQLLALGCACLVAQGRRQLNMIGALAPLQGPALSIAAASSPDASYFLAGTSAAGVVTASTFTEFVLNSPVPVLVDFYATACNPCDLLAPILNQVAGDYGNRVRVLKFNTDDGMCTAADYGVRSVPTLLLFKGGQDVDAIIGAVPKSVVVKALDKLLK